MTIVQATDDDYGRQPNFSLELTKNAKGDRQWTIKVRGDVLDDCYADLTQMDARLERQYGRKEN